MRDYKWLLEYNLNRFGSTAALEAHLPDPRSAAQLRKIGNDRYLSALAQRVFRAGLKHSLVDAKWPTFEEVFFRFDPEKVVLMGAEHLERLMQDARIIRHLGKLKSVPRNAQMILDISKEHGSFGNFIADWPVTDIVGLWKYLSKHGYQLGGMSAPSFLRMVGKDTFIPTYDMVAGLNAQGIIDRVPTSLKDLAAVQGAFNQWHAESGRPMCQLSMMLAYTVNH
ncbi:MULTISPECIES: DNA-3-methyladenine glycosylase I [unclassified Pseudomonas]|uniref:DNA-3-methyladenine glycosylase I n=1 Tax=unclassified Pseudomonas TaxID=196821 RepID=UPI002AC9A8E2|nr:MULTISPECIES: DNA-3-methyladenine glycosylase I [unclassified Pseudomonas]MEB0041278.1 DNA-3-methyladenine glycosylase I [Pseudomonas sp. MH10]MEB0075855.1 DNA-3-methyladenine glycosylase I [Pseudomonas sp. MH10out]MEB0091491.1 DNA-3-methyladenine glycosylase I [Pseudomonas sp. CCI4.2]MEB0104354.1 DNA-3-methyladenine glycosylase I [Pseudomonas sp. CCI3.2]MEB0120401.1 DNA-3-methyladenine glycosylase I [Pseudomonas sp. CCI1.2]